jgi:cell division protein FtsL
MGYKMRDVYNQQRLLQEQRQRLVLEKAALRSMKRVEHIASSELNLVKPNPDQTVILPRHPKAEATSNELHSEQQN